MLKLVRGTLATALAIVVMAACAGIMYEQLGRRATGREFPPVGRLVKFDGKLSHSFAPALPKSRGSKVTFH